MHLFPAHNRKKPLIIVLKISPSVLYRNLREIISGRNCHSLLDKNKLACEHMAY